MEGDATAAQSQCHDGEGRRPKSRTTISDQRFVDQLNQVRNLKTFLFDEKVQFKDNDLKKIDLQELNNVEFSKIGRVPEAHEWSILDEKMSYLSSYLTDDLRRKIRIRELGIFFGIIPLVFLITSIISVVLVTMAPEFLDKNAVLYWVIFLVAMIFWAISQGGLGACAFLGTSVIVNSSEIGAGSRALRVRGTVDVTDRNFLRIRIVLGILFGFLIGLPITNTALNALNDLMFPQPGTPPPSPSKLVFILVPFVVGFSTNLVLLILGRVVSAVENFFGIAGRS